MTPIHGFTFPLRHQLKAMGGRWDAARRCWLVPDARADEARALVAMLAPRSRLRGSRYCHRPR